MDTPHVLSFICDKLCVRTINTALISGINTFHVKTYSKYLICVTEL
jgi:hypothetical protein